jgi:hypothetical protein
MDVNGTNGLRFVGESNDDGCGNAVAAAGDVNADGFSDILIGAPAADPGGRVNTGVTYVVYGSASLSSGLGPDGKNASSTFELSSLDGWNGFALEGVSRNDNSGITMSSAGDIDGDGADEVLVGAPYKNINGVTDCGQSYIVFGVDFTEAPTEAPTNAPTVKPIGEPTAAPTEAPSAVPTLSRSPTLVPSQQPSATPSFRPSGNGVDDDFYSDDAGGGSGDDATGDDATTNDDISGDDGNNVIVIKQNGGVLSKAGAARGSLWLAAAAGLLVAVVQALW